MAARPTIGPHCISIELRRVAPNAEVASEWAISRWFRYEHEAQLLLVTLTSHMAAIVNSERTDAILRDAVAVVTDAGHRFPLDRP